MAGQVKASWTVKRCDKCLMPDSVPTTRLDESGTCQWCRTGFPNYRPLGEAALREILDHNKKPGSPADCLVGISGGKDSVYALLKLQREFGMRVEAFTYVHDGLADFALENARRAARALGVTHHLLSLPNHLHRETCKGFYCAWAQSGDPLAAAMTCVACKHLHILGTRLASRRNIPMVVWSMCPLETPPFIPTQPTESAGEQNASSDGMLRLARRLTQSLVGNRRFRASFLAHLPTCVQGCLSFDPEGRFIRMRYPSVAKLQFFNYWDWNGQSIRQDLADAIGWGVPKTVRMEWHSDCRYNVLKEYMFQKMFGASYTDAFLSNQIRYGLIARPEARRMLLESKAFFASSLVGTLRSMGLREESERVDLSCFDVDDGQQ